MFPAFELAVGHDNRAVPDPVIRAGGQNVQMERAGVVQPQAALQLLQHFPIDLIGRNPFMHPVIDRERRLLSAPVELADEVKVVFALPVRPHGSAEQHRPLRINFRSENCQGATVGGEPIADSLIFFLGLPKLGRRQLRQNANPRQMAIQPLGTVRGESGVSLGFNK